MARLKEGEDYSLVRVKQGRYVVLDSSGAEIGEVVGRRDHWGAYGLNQKRIDTGATRYDAVVILLKKAAGKKL